MFWNEIIDIYEAKSAVKIFYVETGSGSSYSVSWNFGRSNIFRKDISGLISGQQIFSVEIGSSDQK